MKCPISYYDIIVCKSYDGLRHLIMILMIYPNCSVEGNCNLSGELEVISFYVPFSFRLTCCDVSEQIVASEQF